MAVLLSPIGNGAQFFTIGGLPLSGGLLWTYQAGTSTPQPSYTTSVGNIANANPIVLGPDGRPPAEIWLTQGVAYKFSLLDSLSNPISSYDNILGINDFNNINIPGTLTVAGNTTLTNLSVTGNTTLGDAPGDALTVNPANVSWPGNPTHSGNHTFSAATIALAGGVVGPGPVIPITYSPTLTNVANVAASTPGQCGCHRIGNVVVVFGSMSVDPTAATTLTRVGISLPVASNLAGADLWGICSVDQGLTVNVNLSGGVTSDPANDRAELYYVTAADVANRGVNFIFAYTVQ